VKASSVISGSGHNKLKPCRLYYLCCVCVGSPSPRATILEISRADMFFIMLGLTYIYVLEKKITTILSNGN